MIQFFTYLTDFLSDFRTMVDKLTLLLDSCGCEMSRLFELREHCVVNVLSESVSTGCSYRNYRVYVTFHIFCIQITEYICALF